MYALMLENCRRRGLSSRKFLASVCWGMLRAVVRSAQNTAEQWHHLHLIICMNIKRVAGKQTGARRGSRTADAIEEAEVVDSTIRQNHKIRDSARPGYTAGTRMSSNLTNPSAYFPNSFMLLAQNSRASSDNRISSLPCVQNCRAASRAYSQTSNVFAVVCGNMNSRGGTCPSPVGAYSTETWSNAGARRKREPSAKNSTLY